jgi:hypothetical protein
VGSRVLQEGLSLEVPDPCVLAVQGEQLVVCTTFDDFAVIDVPIQPYLVSTLVAKVRERYVQDKVGVSCEFSESVR